MFIIQQTFWAYPFFSAVLNIELLPSVCLSEQRNSMGDAYLKFWLFVGVGEALIREFTVKWIVECFTTSKCEGVNRFLKATYLFFGYLICPSVFGPKTLKTGLRLQHFRKRIEKYGVIVGKKVFGKNFADTFLVVLFMSNSLMSGLNASIV